MVALHFDIFLLICLKVSVMKDIGTLQFDRAFSGHNLHSSSQFYEKANTSALIFLIVSQSVLIKFTMLPSNPSSTGNMDHFSVYSSCFVSGSGYQLSVGISVEGSGPFCSQPVQHTAFKSIGRVFQLLFGECCCYCMT